MADLSELRARIEAEHGRACAELESEWPIGNGAEERNRPRLKRAADAVLDLALLGYVTGTGGRHFAIVTNLLARYPEEGSTDGE